MLVLRSMIALTGSNGKTTTKEAVAAVLSQQAPTLKT
ncbi:MAG TPA: Mur ligase family protein [Ktedonobacteraceae bacterium]